MPQSPELRPRNSQQSTHSTGASPVEHPQQYARRKPPPLEHRVSDSRRHAERAGSNDLSDAAQSHTSLRQASVRSERSHSGSNSQANLSSVMSHYMQTIGTNGMNDILANDYYGNMDVLRESANRQPRPINSTLPLFSPSVFSGRRVPRVRSSTGSDTSGGRNHHAYVPGQETMSYAGTGPRVAPEAAGLPGGPRPESASKVRSTSAVGLGGGGQVDRRVGEKEEQNEEMSMRRRKTDAGVVSNTQEPLQEAATQAKEITDAGATEQSAMASVPRPSDNVSTEHTDAGALRSTHDGQNKPTIPAADETGLGTRPETPPHADALPKEESPRRASTGSLRGKDGEAKVAELSPQPETRPSSQARLRKPRDMGTTQYKPANATGKSAVARGAPGLSYMFSPQIGSSRPSSVISVATPPHQQQQQQQQQQQNQYVQSALRVTEDSSAKHERRPSSLVGSPNATKSPTPADESQEGPGAVQPAGMSDQGERVAPGMDAETEAKDFMEAPERKPYGSINIGALERFLDEGEIPESSSDDEFDDDDDSDLGWEEDYISSNPSLSRYPSHHSSPSSAQRTGSGLQVNYRQHLSYPWPRHHHPGYYHVHTTSASPHKGLGIGGSALNQPNPASSRNSPYLQGSDGQPIPDDERTHLLQSRDTSAPPQYNNEASKFIVPADMANMDDGLDGRRGRLSNMQNMNGADDAAVLEWQKRRGRRRSRREQRHHEELFIDKNGFIDESYRFTFFNPMIGTIRAQEFADLRTPKMDLAELLQAGGCFWIDVFRPSLQEMHLISKIFRIHALNVEDIMTQDSREKCEIHANYYFVCFRSFDNNHNSDSYLEPKCIYNIVLREGIITFHMEPSAHQYHVLRRIRRQTDHIVVTPDWLNYAIIDDITDLLAPIMQVIEFEVDAIDELVLVISSSEQSDMLLRISNVRKKIMMVMRLLHGKSDVVRALIKRFESATAISVSQMNAMAGNAVPVPASMADRTAPAGGGACSWGDSPRHRVNNNNDFVWMYSTDASDPAMEVALDQRKGHETILYLGDVLDHILTMLQNSAHYDNVLSRAQANYLAQISIELTESSNRTNDVVAKLSALAAIVVPLNFITGMWGANVKVPGQDYDDLHYFFMILGMCMLYVVAAVCFARHYKIF
ncbi:CorA metal ion transporter [Coemansia sp. RSA 1939]|nr:CorA metal ion transporter [Coemansia sp. RSA 1939]